MTLDHGQVDAAFTRLGVSDPHPPYEAWGTPEELFIDLHAALVTPAIIGKNLLGEAEYKNLQNKAQPGQQAILLMSRGRYSFLGSGFVRGGIFDRFQLTQGDSDLLFRDKQYKRLSRVAASGAPEFPEIGLFLVPREMTFDPAQPFRVTLIAQRVLGAIEKSFTRFHLDYTLPDAFLKHAPPPTAAPPEDAPPAPVWEGIWQGRKGDVATLGAALLLLTAGFFFQDRLVARPRLFLFFKYGFLAFTALWLGLYAQAQLSVVNVLTYINAVMTGFRWDFFLLEPLIFILWSAVFMGLFFWGRGVYCGWLCPFGAIQELLNKAARRLGVRQLKVPFYLHERLWPIKYLLFFLLLGVSFHSVARAEILAEVEPFKTALLLRFDREWPFVAYALALLAAGLFLNRFFCRYLCPLGAALAIPDRLRMFDWLKRRWQCGAECGLCSDRCEIQAIQPDGRIHVNECFYCLDCQVIYHDATLCPPLKKRREREVRRFQLRRQLEEKADHETES